MLFGNVSRMIEIAAAHNFGKFFSDELIVFGNEAALSHHMQRELNCGLRLFAHHENVGALDRLNITRLSERENVGFCVGDETVAV